jgi:hypothetical protein
MRKEKKKEKRKALPAARRPGSPLEPAARSFPRADGPLEPSSFLPSSLALAWAGLGAVAAAALFLCFADAGARMSVVSSISSS